MYTLKKNALVLALTSAALLCDMPASHASQISAEGYATTWSPSSSINNNFTMLTGSGVFAGGVTDVSMTWDGTVFTANSDYTGPGGAHNMTLSSPGTFNGYTWVAHDVQVFRPGTYTFDTALGSGNGEKGIQTLAIGAGQLGAHMLYDWNGNLNIDVSVVWNPNGVFGTTTNQQTLTGTAIWNAVSIDGDTLPGPGIGMALDGPTTGFQLSFNLNGITPAAVPLPYAIWLLGSGLIGMLTMFRKKK